MQRVNHGEERGGKELESEVEESSDHGLNGNAVPEKELKNGDSSQHAADSVQAPECTVPAIELSNVTLSWKKGGAGVVRNISFKVKRGELVVIMGDVG